MTSISKTKIDAPSSSFISSKAVKIGVIVVGITTILTLGALLLAHYGYLQKGIAYCSEIYHHHVKPSCQQLGVEIQRSMTIPLPAWVTLCASVGSGLVGGSAAFGGYWLYLKKNKATLESIQNLVF